ncbi:MAG: hypothetical protein KAJ29_00505 [Alphaproteobacteria bacterium]|nr:hypothetical protein [Alphaproteobacteria bacterium]
METPDLEKGETKQIIIPEMKNVSLIKGNKSPDGYEYIYRNRRGGLFLGIFGGRSGRTQYFLRKNNRYIPLLKGGEKRYSANMYFIGWIKEESGEK